LLPFIPKIGRYGYRNENGSPLQEWLESESWRTWKSIGLTGLKGSSKAYLLALWQEKIRGPFLVVVLDFKMLNPFLKTSVSFRRMRRSLPSSFLRGKRSPIDKIAPHPESSRRG